MLIIRKLALAVIVGAIAISLDQYTKLYMLDVIASEGDLQITSFFKFIIVRNYGVSFGTFNDPKQSQLIFIGLSLLIISVFIIWLLRAQEQRLWLPVGLVVGGAIGNVIDRIMYGAVIDFIDITIFHWRYPTFNLADAFICIGILLLIFLPNRAAHQ